MISKKRRGIKKVEPFFKISLEKQNSRYEMKSEHYHDYYEFYYLLHGARRMFLNNKVYRLHDGDLVAISKGTIHRTSYLIEDQSLDSCERIVIAFHRSFLGDFIGRIGYEQFSIAFYDGKITIPEKRKAYFEDLMYRMLEEYKQKDELSGFLCQNYCEEMILFLIRCRKYLQNDVEAGKGMEDYEMERAVEYINMYFDKRIDLHSVAVIVNMSDSYFSKRFKKATGFGFKEYLNTVRIKHACDLLLSTKLPVTEISERCGYMDSNYFGDAFKKVKKLSPRDYRKSNIV